MVHTEKQIHKVLDVEALNKTMFLSHLEHQGKTLAGKSDMNPCHFSPVFLPKELEEASRYGSLVHDHICKGKSITVHIPSALPGFL